MKAEVYVEFHGKKVESKSLIEHVKTIWKDDGKLVKDLQDVQLFYKPDEHKCFYVINEHIKGSFNV